MKNLLLTFAFVSCQFFGFAQDFDFSASVPVVDTGGYHAIVLDPELVGRSKDRLQDVRLKDESGKNVPFVMQQDEAISSETVFVPFNIIRKEIIPDLYTVLEIEPTQRAELDQIHLEVANADVSKPVEITGSDDRKQWYAVRSTTVGVHQKDAGATSALSVFNLPRTAHAYYRITIGDSLSAPLKILDVGHQGRTRKIGQYSEASGYEIVTEQVDGATRLWIYSAYPITFDKLKLDIGNENPYHRNFTVSDHKTLQLSRRQRRQGLTPIRQDVILSGSLNSEHLNAFPLPGIRADTVLIEIQNGDDTPLHVADIHIEQLQRRLVAELTPNENYTLHTGNKDIQAPRFDIGRFISPNTVMSSVVHHDPLADHRQEKTGGLHAISKYWMWLVIGGLVVFMLIMVARLMKDQKQRETSNSA